ncbi:hypothetical protein [Brevibacillus thermoruber]|uniref:hypothetical protein n=2 Tax=Bacillales TaxID=1385 RepID=UPI0003FDCC1D|nr:hypothetical protein [Brevibacillus thermoruber]
MTGTRLLRDRLSVQNRFARLARAGIRLPVLFFQRARDQHLTGPFEERRGAARQPERRKGTVHGQAAPGAPAEQACPPVESEHAKGHDRGKTLLGSGADRTRDSESIRDSPEPSGRHV